MQASRDKELLKKKVHSFFDIPYSWTPKHGEVKKVLLKAVTNEPEILLRFHTYP